MIRRLSLLRERHVLSRSRPLPVGARYWHRRAERLRAAGYHQMAAASSLTHSKRFRTMSVNAAHSGTVIAMAELCGTAALNMVASAALERLGHVAELARIPDTELASLGGHAAIKS